MVDHRAFGPLGTFSVARVHTLLSDARQVIGTVCVQNTFWPTGWRDTLVAGQTGAGGAAVLLTALRVRAARAGLARVPWARWFG